MATTQRVKTLYRTISKFASPIDGALAVSDVDAELSEWYNKGYVLFSTTFVGEDEYSFRVMYVFHRPEGK